LRNRCGIVKEEVADVDWKTESIERQKEQDLEKESRKETFEDRACHRYIPWCTPCPPYAFGMSIGIKLAHPSAIPDWWAKKMDDTE